MYFGQVWIRTACIGDQQRTLVHVAEYKQILDKNHMLKWDLKKKTCDVPQFIFCGILKNDFSTRKPKIIPV